MDSLTADDMLALFLASATFLHGVRPVTQPRIPPVMAIGSDRAAAEAQLAEYFAMAPWEKTIELIPNQRLDLRMFVQPFDRGGAIIAAVFVNQKGLPIIDGGGGAGFGVKRGRLWRCVGTITARTEEDLSTAVANQRELIIAWAGSSYRIQVRKETAPAGRLHGPWLAIQDDQSLLSEAQICLQRRRRMTACNVDSEPCSVKIPFRQS